MDTLTEALRDTSVSDVRDIEVGLNFREDLKEQYRECFQPHEYCDTYYKDMDDEVKFFLDSHYDFIREGVSHSWFHAPVSVLDVGCGPVPVYAAAVVAALRSSSTMTMADMLPQNREALARWQEQRPGALDWSQHLSHVAARASTNCSCLAEEVRSSINYIVPCDVLESPPLATIARYDIVMTTLCLEFATAIEEDYRSSVARLAELAGPGIFLMAGALGNTCYQLGGRAYPAVPLTEAVIRDALECCGMRVLRLRTLLRTTDYADKPTDHTGVFFVAARTI